jgi:hypothetical protein
VLESLEIQNYRNVNRSWKQGFEISLRKERNGFTTVDMGSGQTIARAGIAEGASLRAGG